MSKSNKVGQIRSFEGYKDIERLNRLTYKKEDTNERSTSIEDNIDCSKVAIDTLIDILSTTIARMDKLESTVQQMASKIYDIKQ